MTDAPAHDIPVTDPLSARSEILTRIRSANRGGHSGAHEAWENIPRAYCQSGRLSIGGRVQLITERLIEYGAGVYPCQPAQVADNIAEILRSRMKQRMLLSSEVDVHWLPLDGPIFVADNVFSYSEIEACDGVLTGCTVAIAVTGSLALCHTSIGSRRALTLLPDYHLCVINAADIVETVPEGIRQLEPYRLQPITLISGPSATADIEMTRIQGVHGPRVLDCVIVV
ncbi:MAG: LutC/YkgG family protein [Acidobacteriaceae bacterium]